MKSNTDHKQATFSTSWIILTLHSTQLLFILWNGINIYIEKRNENLQDNIIRELVDQHKVVDELVRRVTLLEKHHKTEQPEALEYDTNKPEHIRGRRTALPWSYLPPDWNSTFTRSQADITAADSASQRGRDDTTLPIHIDEAWVLTTPPVTSTLLTSPPPSRPHTSQILDRPPFRSEVLRQHHQARRSRQQNKQIRKAKKEKRKQKRGRKRLRQNTPRLAPIQTTAGMTSTTTAFPQPTPRPTTRRPTKENRTPAPATGSTFIRWGKFGCPQAAGSTSLLYNGYAAASYPLKGLGGSTQLQCLPYRPTWNSNTASTPLGRTLLTAAKFSLAGHRGVFDTSLDNSLVLCAVCYTQSSPTLMIPGRVDCPYRWTRQYYGHLMSSAAISNEHYDSSQTYCVDIEPDPQRGHNDTHGQKLTFVQAGSCFNDLYPCNRYPMGNKLGCTVCSKE